MNEPDDVHPPSLLLTWFAIKRVGFAAMMSANMPLHHPKKSRVVNTENHRLSSYTDRPHERFRLVRQYYRAVSAPAGTSMAWIFPCSGFILDRSTDNNVPLSR